MLTRDLFHLFFFTCWSSSFSLPRRRSHTKAKSEREGRARSLWRSSLALRVGIVMRVAGCSPASIAGYGTYIHYRRAFVKPQSGPRRDFGRIPAGARRQSRVGAAARVPSIRAAAHALESDDA
jgi:hypothetical protein